MSQRSVYCIASSRGRADRIVHDLKDADFPSTEVSALFLEQNAGEEPASGRKASGPADAIRGVMGWIAGGGRVVIPGVDPLIAAGPVAAALGGATAGGVAGGLMDFGIPPAEARCYEGRIKDGAFLISIQSANPDRGDRAREIFTAEGAEHICTLTDISAPKPSGKNAHGGSRRTAA